MLPLGGVAAVLRDRGPAVGEDLHVPLAGVDHGLDGERHARLDPHSRPGLPVVEDLRLLVEHPPDTVAAELAHDGAVVALGMVLDRVPDVAEPGARPHPLDPAPHALAADPGDPLADERRLADEEHAAGIAVVAILDHRDVDVDDVAVLQPPIARDAVADHVVDRRADGLRKAAVVEWGGDRLLLLHDVPVADGVELSGGHPRGHVRLDHLQHLRGEPSGDAHPVDFFGGLDGDRHTAGRQNGRPDMV